MWPYTSSSVILPARALMWASTIAAGPAVGDFMGMKRAREDEVGGEEQYEMPPAKRMMNNRVRELWLEEEVEEEGNLEEDLDAEDEEYADEDADEDAEGDAEEDVEGDAQEDVEGDVEEDVGQDVEGDVDGDVEEDVEEEEDDREDINQDYEQEDGDESWDDVREITLDHVLPGHSQIGEMMEESERRLFDPPDYNWPDTIEELKESYL
ncbi:hypothetical protein EWM64_g2399 [Hericium alpestre]|uniref:Uncharacterized protein n=1 Tax=Hericium alpestre TaxID=135208 RepID=A0A4Z0A3M0_9AGAM|nr:hypothetical protein EWM64_g2399 [Hericium alpestre]